VGEKLCFFRVDTGSDISILNKKLINFSKGRLPLGNNFPKYPTGEKVAVQFRVSAQIAVGKFSLEFPFFVAEISDDCILGVDFLKRVNLIKILEPEFGNGVLLDKETMNCSRVIFEGRIPIFLNELLQQGSEGLEVEQKNNFISFLSEFQDVFSENISAGNCKVLEHSINVLDKRPIKQSPRRIPIHLRREVESILDDMKCQGVIEESQSSWLSPAVMVKKKDGTLRFCVDYRKLNAVTEKDCYPLPRMDDILDHLAGNSWFTTLDLKSGYWQIGIRPEDREKTAFSIGRGLWQFKVMPFGLCNAPATFERLMEKVLHGVLHRICLVYLDDVIVYSKTFAGMLKNLREVFLRLRGASLKINPKKCSLFSREVKYLGHIISEKGIATDPEKTSAIENWPIPKNKKQVRSFLGFCSYYRRFVKGFSSEAKPLFKLTENHTKFIWTDSCQKAFISLKRVLISSPVLSFPIEEEEFILDTDASNHGLGAVLSQKQEGKEKVIAYFSRVLNKSERNYCVTRRELLAIVSSIKSFHHYLYGRKFLIRTDHVSLRWLMSFKELEGQLARWLERLQQYEFEIVHRKGELHRNADGLSRRPCLDNNCNYCAKVELKEISSEENTVARIILKNDISKEWREDQLADSVISVFLKAKECDRKPLFQDLASLDSSAKVYYSYWNALFLKNGVLYKRWESPNSKLEISQVIVPSNRINQILVSAHDSPSGGHFGINKTLDKIRKRFYWASYKQDVEKWCRTCKICNARNGPSGKGKSPLQIYNVNAPFERVQMDILGPLPVSSSGNRYLLVVVDCFTKWVEAFPLRNPRAKTIAKIFVNQVISRHGVPLELHTDQGRNFESKLFRELMCLLGIKKTRTTPLHPQSDGQVERQHRTILNYLSKFILENQKDWDEWIPMCLLACRTSKHESTGATPAELYFARDLRLPLDLLRGSYPDEREKSRENCVQNLKERLNTIHQNARQHLNFQSSRAKNYYDRKIRQVDFKEGQSVWLFNPQRKKGITPKLQSNWEGSYKIVKKLSDVTFRIQKSARHKFKVVHADRLAPFKERERR